MGAVCIDPDAVEGTVEVVWMLPVSGS